MNIYKIIFILIFIWSGIYTSTAIVYNFRSRAYFAAINGIVSVIISIALCGLYVLR